ncbi:MAG: biotin synthase BioB [Flavobacteriales bacterium]|nr:biotin synthase BioB [Flavobacteriales bacterium]
MADIRYDWTKEEILEIHKLPLLELVHRAGLVHREHHDPLEVQVSSLLSIKTGGCVEDCSYCPQAARYHTGVEVHKLLPLKEVVESAQNAKKGGASRFCMGAAWREVRDNSDFDKVLDMVREVNSLGMEVCCTLGMLTEEQAKKLDEAGVYAYNHNIDTSEEHYSDIISTRTYGDRLNTIKNIRKTKMTVCSGGIIGLGETVEDRIGMLLTLSTMNPHPESVPVNALVPVEGTPLADQETVSSWEMIRMVATARIVMPQAAVRLSAGRGQMSKEAQAMCFMSGANSIFAGDKLLTTPNPEFNEDMQLFQDLGIKAKEPIPRKGSAPVEA